MLGEENIAKTREVAVALWGAGAGTYTGLLGGRGLAAPRCARQLLWPCRSHCVSRISCAAYVASVHGMPLPGNR